jgi:hypothetical protein
MRSVIVSVLAVAGTALAGGPPNGEPCLRSNIPSIRHTNNSIRWLGFI